MKIKNVLEQILGVTKIWGEGGGLYGGKVKVAGHLSVPWAPPATRRRAAYLRHCHRDTDELLSASTSLAAATAQPQLWEKL